MTDKTEEKDLDGGRAPVQGWAIKRHFNDDTFLEVVHGIDMDQAKRDSEVPTRRELSDLLIVVRALYRQKRLTPDGTQKFVLDSFFEVIEDTLVREGFRIVRKESDKK